MIEREEREYSLADEVVVLSTFAYDSFRAERIPESKLDLLPLGSQTSGFPPRTPNGRSAPRTHRVGRTASGLVCRRPLLPKRSDRPSPNSWESLGARSSFALSARSGPKRNRQCLKLKGRAEFRGKKPQMDLLRNTRGETYSFFPTVEDGFAVVLAQASAAALPILTTHELLRPPTWCERVEPAGYCPSEIRRHSWIACCGVIRTEANWPAWSRRRTRNSVPADWSDVAADFEALCRARLSRKADPIPA